LFIILIGPCENALHEILSRTPFDINILEQTLTHYRQAMPFGNIKHYFRGFKNISPLETWNLLI